MIKNTRVSDPITMNEQPLQVWKSSFTWAAMSPHENQQSLPSLRNAESHLEDHKS
ncbi:hypothetical protein DPMN_048578 [Dreissena polymorpha]|uniref:Uncharacterized protein n=1 Tax=Dreissena polymorpha TaxID=45954 RepID=A0A9D4I2J1_DREPO|nr:hypothetical protein DPMN_048578 [Dreissena polymorpha]